MICDPVYSDKMNEDETFPLTDLLVKDSNGQIFSFSC